MSTKGNVADKAKMFAERSKLDTIICDKCNKHILKNAPDHIVFESNVYHLDQFKCSVCKSQLKAGNVIKYQHELFCQNHNPLRDQNRLSIDTGIKHRQRSNSQSEEYQAIRVRKDHKNLQLPQNWIGTSMTKIAPEIVEQPKVPSHSNLAIKEQEIITLPVKVESNPSKIINDIKIQVEYEEIKRSFEKLELESKRRNGGAEVQSMPERDDHLRRRVYTDGPLRHVNSQKLKNIDSVVLESPKDYFLELPDYWYELDYSHSKPKSNKPPILVMGDEALHHQEFSRENMRHFTKLGISPYQNYDMEWVDVLCLYYRHFIKKLDHTNYVALIDEGPVLISVYMEKGESSSDEESSQLDISNIMDALKDNKYKILMRWKGGLDWRLIFFESEFRNRTGIKNTVNRRKILSYLHPSLLPTKLIKITDPNIKDEICKLDELRITTEYKFGVLVIKPEQYKEEDVFANKEGSSNYEEFLSILGNKIELHGYTGYCGGLDPKNGRTGIHSVSTKFSDFEIMYHVSTMLPFDPADSQQIQRKRHIGNDIVCAIFLEEGAKFNPAMIASKFLHCYICVQKVEQGWRVVIAANKHIPYFGPPLPNPNIFTDKAKLRDFLLTKRN